MLAFELFVDDRRICVAGMEDWAVMSVILSGVRRREQDPDDAGRLDIAAGGLSETGADGASFHSRWEKVDLTVGSRVVINLVETDQPDPPIKRYRSDREHHESPFTDEEIEEMEREDYARLKAKFEPSPGDRA
ncbi:hypothetical protein [Sphingomonas sp.]|uniref:hypothetical protein n=1 Tax=Sphingomonas sp. TaxID=28214 RepID=UPI00286E47DD|nr:hypothetical protein [Sphingomonas sp.]